MGLRRETDKLNQVRIMQWTRDGGVMGLRREAGKLNQVRIMQWTCDGGGVMGLWRSSSEKSKIISLVFSSLLLSCVPLRTGACCVPGLLSAPWTASAKTALGGIVKEGGAGGGGRGGGVTPQVALSSRASKTSRKGARHGCLAKATAYVNARK
jgi:hypothetical protein